MLTIVNRAHLLRSSGALLLGAGVLPSLAVAAPPDADLANLRLVIATELLKIDFATHALASGKAPGATAALLRQAKADDTAHYHGLASLFTGAGQIPATADDIDFSYPARSFASPQAIVKLAWTLGSLAVGAYNGVLVTTQSPRFRTALAQIAANEAQQRSSIQWLLGKPIVGPAFGPTLSADEVTTALDLYES
jgi:hypothetical protein